MLRTLKFAWELIDRIRKRFDRHDVWALASHIALSFLLALFPFLIALTALATFVGASSYSDDAVKLILDTWPKEVAAPIAAEIKRILTIRRSGILTVGFVLALYFASSGVDSLRIGLNRAYGAVENRSWILLKLLSLLFVVVGAATMLSFGFLLVLGPLLWKTLINYSPQELQPWLKQITFTVDVFRIGVTACLFIFALFFVHKLIPAGRRAFLTILPGILVTVLLWVAGGVGFGWYLSRFSMNYVSTYGSLATAMMTLVFLYMFSVIFLLGGEINGALKSMVFRRSAGEKAA
ncbi:MAG: YihY/virulence factor BrkB family protein [Methylobacteriaceae bacterium]|nr:YihY/virulence factor BrkB family protein [Methylobacteriaceae bacterium]